MIVTPNNPTDRSIATVIEYITAPAPSWHERFIFIIGCSSPRHLSPLAFKDIAFVGDRFSGIAKLDNAFSDSYRDGATLYCWLHEP